MKPSLKSLFVFLTALYSLCLLSAGCSDKKDNVLKPNPQDTTSVSAKRAPVFTSYLNNYLKILKVGVSYSDTLRAMDPYGYPIRFALIKNPSGMALADSVVSWMPSVKGTDTISAVVTDSANLKDTLTWILSVRTLVRNVSIKTSLTVPDFYFNSDYMDTILATDTGYTYRLLDSSTWGTTTLTFDPADSFCIVRWTYEAKGKTDYDSIPHGFLPLSVEISNGTTKDTLSWHVRINTVPSILTTQFQIATTVYLNTTYQDTIYAWDQDGDIPYFILKDPGRLGARITGTGHFGDTNFAVFSYTVTKSDTFALTFQAVDPAGIYSKDLAVRIISYPKTIITSQQNSMTYGASVGAVYKDTIGIFPDYRSGYTARLLSGPSGMTLSDSVVSWTPSAPEEATVKVVVSHPNYKGGAPDTLSWPVKAVGTSNYVFWYSATKNGYNLQQCDDGKYGPCLPADITVYQGTIATWETKLRETNNDDAFVLGNGPLVAGFSSMFYSEDLCNLQGTAVKAQIRGEFRDGWAGDAFCQSGRITMKVGVIDLTVYKNAPAPKFYGGTIACNSLYLGGNSPCFNSWNYNMKFYIDPRPTGTTINGLMAEEIVTIEAVQGRTAGDEPSVLDGQFFSIDVTRQVQWILNQKGKDYVTRTIAGDYAIVFLVPNDITAGGPGKVNLYASECTLPPFGAANDNPWTSDGNTMHLFLQGSVTTAP